MLKNNFLFYFACLFMLLNYYKVNSYNIILTNQTGYDLIVEARYKLEESQSQVIITRSLLANLTDLDVSSNFVNKFLIGKNINQDSLISVVVRYEDSDLSESFTGRNIMNYQIELPLQEIKAKSDDEPNGSIDVYLTSGILAGISYNYKMPKNKVDLLSERVLNKVILTNSSKSNMIIVLELLHKFKFHQFKTYKYIELPTDGVETILLHQYFDAMNSSETLIVTDIYANFESSKYLKTKNLKSLDLKKNWKSLDLNQTYKDNLHKINNIQSDCIAARITLNKENRSSGTQIGEKTGIKLLGGPAVYIEDTVYYDSECLT